MSFDRMREFREQLMSYKPYYLAPILKYPGGKRDELVNILPYVPTKFDTYIEPFLGGGALYFFLTPKKALIADTSKPLINFYQTVKTDYDTLIKQIKSLQTIWKKNLEEYHEARKDPMYFGVRVENKNELLYYQMRDVLNGTIDYAQLDDALEGSGIGINELLPATAYFFVNYTAFGGLIRYNSRGEFNVPFGFYQRLAKRTTLLQDHSDLLQKAQIENWDYHQTLEMAKPRDFVFIDPPYDSVFRTFTNTGLAFDEEDHKELARVYKQLPCPALLVVRKTDLMLELYKDYIVEEYAHTYKTNIKNRYNRQSSHLIVANYDINELNKK